MEKFTYSPAAFDVADMEAAKRIILTENTATATEERWARETPYLGEYLASSLGLTAQSVVVDYGCGIGRLARDLIGRTGCCVIGVDISQAMRGLAPDYVASPRFSALSRGVFEASVRCGLRVDAAFAVWALQHCKSPSEDIGLIAAGLRQGGRFGLVNTRRRFVPVIEAPWVDDHQDVFALTSASLDLLARTDLDAAFVGASHAREGYAALFTKP